MVDRTVPPRPTHINQHGGADQGDQQKQPGHFIAALDGQRVGDLVAAAKLVAAKARGDEIELSVIVLERSGFGVRRYSGDVTLKVR